MIYRTVYSTSRGRMVLGNSEEVIPQELADGSVNLIVTSPPFGLLLQKEYGNVEASQYLDWFRPFAREFHRVLSPDGSLVLDIGGAWERGQPTRSIYHFRLLIMLCDEFGFHLSQEFYWWNPSRLPSPAEWVNVRRLRMKDAVDPIWWLSPSPWPKADNRRLIQPYSLQMQRLLQNGQPHQKRPSGHTVSQKFVHDNRGAIPPNLLAIAKPCAFPVSIARVLYPLPDG